MQRATIERAKREVAEAAGLITGVVVAPLFALGSRVRRARFFHPEGSCYLAQVSSQADEALTPLADRLQGCALVRLSTAWWRGGKQWPDALGCAIRFFRDHDPMQPDAADQDLLFATIPRPWLTPLAPLFTTPHDFLANIYYGTSPFVVDGLGKARLRLMPVARVSLGDGRQQRLAEAVQRGEASFVLQALVAGRDWQPVVQIALTDRVQVDQEALRFSPFRAGRGIEPSGFVHAMRRVVYPASQAARPREQG